MPVINLERKRFSKFVGHELDIKEIIDWLPWLGFDIEEIGDRHVKAEFNPNRIDFSSSRWENSFWIQVHRIHGESQGFERTSCWSCFVIRRGCRYFGWMRSWCGS